MKYLLALYQILTEPSITDYIQAGCAFLGLLVSGLGIYYVVKSFEEQVRINKRQEVFNEQQLKLIQIEDKRSSREVKPTLVIETVTENTYKSTGGVHIPFVIRCIENTANGLCFEYLKVGPGAWYSDNMLIGGVLGDIKIPYPLYFSIAVTFRHQLFIDLRIHYLDVDGRALSDDFRIRGFHGPGRLDVDGITIKPIAQSEYTKTPYPAGNKTASWQEGEPYLLIKPLREEQKGVFN